MAVMTEIRDAITRLASEVGPSLVGVGHRWGVGSGVVLAPGKVLTNAHNVRGADVTIAFSDGRTETGSVAGID
ncbi:MAG: S1C family serine protease, partial [Actinomycetota bacterium]